ncbi:PAS domain S-box protein [bacterium]|nr:PAS domain S-box protein [bacterium]
MTDEHIPENSDVHSGLQRILQDLLSSEDAVQKEAVLLPHIIESMSDGVVVANKEGELVLFNKVAKKILQQDLSQTTPEQWSEHYGVFYPDELTPYPSGNLPLARAIQGHSVDDVQLFIRHANLPEGVLIACDARPIFDWKGQLRGGVAVFRDITLHARGEKALRESEHRYRTLFENLPIGVYRTTPDGRILDVNPALLRMLGYSSRDEMIQRNLETGHFEAEYSRSEFRLRLETEGSIHGLESVWKRKDGTSIFIRENANVVHDITGNLHFYEGTLEDITERVLAERKKQEVLSIVSHELRTPLTAVLGSLEFQDEKLLQGNIEQCLKSVRVAVKSAKRMLRLIDDLLDLDKIESGKMRFLYQWFDLIPVIEEAIDGVRSFADKFDVELKMETGSPSVYINADQDRLIQVITNLLSNAAKHSPAGEKVLVSVLRKAGQVHVRVTDRGPGIPEEFRNQVFEKFAQSDYDAVSKVKGTGLGLSISKAIIEKMGGRVGYYTERGAGTTFYCTFPESDRNSRL